MKNKVSIIIPVYNSEVSLGECLSSVFSLNYKSDYEVIVVDDCSADSSVKIAEQYPCRVIKLNKRVGPAIARNKGAEVATGNILVFLDSDCVVRDNWLEVIMDCFDEDCDAVAAQYCGNLEKGFISEFAFLEIVYRERKYPRFPNTASSCNLACRKSAFKEIGGFPDMFPAEDMLFSYNFSRKFRILWDQEIAVYHRFRKKLIAYLKQQFSYSKADVGLYIKKPSLLKVDTFENKNNYFEIIFTGTLIFFSVLSIFVKDLIFISLVSVIILLLLNIGFFRFLYKKKGVIFLLLSVPTIIIRNLTWITGISYGLINIIVKK